MPDLSNSSRFGGSLIVLGMSAALACMVIAYLPRSTQESAPQTTQSVLTLTNSRMPNADSSRPQPESFTPPKGKRTSDLTKSFTKQTPASKQRATRSPRFASLVNTAEPKP